MQSRQCAQKRAKNGVGKTGKVRRSEKDEEEKVLYWCWTKSNKSALSGHIVKREAAVQSLVFFP